MCKNSRTSFTASAFIQCQKHRALKIKNTLSGSWLGSTSEAPYTPHLTSGEFHPFGYWRRQWYAKNLNKIRSLNFLQKVLTDIYALELHNSHSNGKAAIFWQWTEQNRDLNCCNSCTWHTVKYWNLLRIRTQKHDVKFRVCLYLLNLVAVTYSFDGIWIRPTRQGRDYPFWAPSEGYL